MVHSRLDEAHAGNFTDHSVFIRLVKYFPQAPGLRVCVVPVLFALAAPMAGAALESNLIEHSPFLPPGWGKKTETAPVVEEAPVVQGPLSRELEFRGIFEMGGEIQFSIFDKSTQEGKWIPLNGGTDRFSIIRYNEGKESIMVKSGSRLEEITLADPDDKPMPVVGQAPPNFTPPTAPPNFKPPTSPPSSPPSTSPPSTIPPPPPAALLNARNNASGTTVPRRRIIRRTSDSTSSPSSSSSSSGTNLPSNIPPPPNYTPGSPPNFTPPPPNTSN